MKRMYSEEELLESANTENLVDSKGRNRFIVGDGNPGSVTGLTVSSSKWTLNGNNLVFEILGTFSGNNLSGLEKLSIFTLPEWIINSYKNKEYNTYKHNKKQKACSATFVISRTYSYIINIKLQSIFNTINTLVFSSMIHKHTLYIFHERNYQYICNKYYYS